MTLPGKNQKVGLALSGGAVLGAAHAGVLRALEEHNITIDCISGTSIGALVASLYAFGWDYEHIKNFAIDISWRNLTDISFSKMGVLSNRKIRSEMLKDFGSVNFDDAKIPLAIVATNITTGGKVVLKKGDVGKAVMASTCIPGIFDPVEIDGELLVDGGIVENVPVSPLEEMGADFIIAVDLNARYLNSRPKNIIDLLLNSFHLTLSTASKLQTEYADIIIRPDLSQFNMVDTKQIAPLIKEGYREAITVLENNP